MSTIGDIKAVAIPGEPIPSIVAVIVMSERHSHLRRVLATPEHRAAIDSASGDKFAVLHLPVASGRREVKGGGPAGTMGMLVEQWIEPWENRDVLETLGIDSSEEPWLVVWVEDEEGALRTSRLSLSDESEDKARNRLLEACDIVREAVAGVAPENLNASDRVFQVVDDALDNRRTRDFLRRVRNVVVSVARLRP